MVEHYGFSMNFTEHFILTNFTSKPTSNLIIGDGRVPYKNLNSVYDQKFINEIKLFDNELKEYMSIQESPDKMLEFFRLKPQFKDLSDNKIAELLLKDFFLTLHKCVKGQDSHSVDLVEVGVPNTGVEITKIEDPLELKVMREPHETAKLVLGVGAYDDVDEIHGILMNIFKI